MAGPVKWSALTRGCGLRNMVKKTLQKFLKGTNKNVKLGKGVSLLEMIR